MDERAVRQLVAAVENPGPHPQHHREVMARHRQEWPALWRAIDALVAEHQRPKMVIHISEPPAPVHRGGPLMPPLNPPYRR